MRFETIEEYNNKLKEIEQTLSKLEPYIKKHPEELGTKDYYETYKQTYNIINNDKFLFIDEINLINFQFDDDLEKKALTISEFYNLTNNLNKIINLATKTFTDENTEEYLLVNSLITKHCKITLSFPNPTEEDVKHISPRKKGLLKIFDFINCGDDIEKLKKEIGSDNHDILLSYEHFLKEIVNQNRGFILDTEIGMVKSGLTLQQCETICNNLKLTI